MTDKKSIRKEIFKRKQRADLLELADKSHIICEKVIGLDAFLKSDTIFTYVDFNREVETRKIIETAWRMGKKVAVPRVAGRDMDFYLIDSMEELAPGYFDIPEPLTNHLAEDESALMVVPGVAFDPKCHRAGYGQGFYDRYLEKHPYHHTVAVAFDFQIVAEVPSEPTDIRPDMVITETAVFLK